MIAPDRTRTELLAEIDASDPGSDPLSDITDPRVAATDARDSTGADGLSDASPALAYHQVRRARG